ncbi:hypothetical protein PMAYCL1PPCAC_33146 [Pristionchus mayeri]|uniref:Uncharacterized protein n=1 Tax=Pristionchus mayeri TaxID=1317129 RepID=A0AAN5DH82_9BILA|nr:hypothetical protein PMAYCL1PPCAC_33146 [Pristionchus mayeri]
METRSKSGHRKQQTFDDSTPKAVSKPITFEALDAELQYTDPYDEKEDPDFETVSSSDSSSESDDESVLTGEMSAKDLDEDDTDDDDREDRSEAWKEERERRLAAKYPPLPLRRGYISIGGVLNDGKRLTRSILAKEKKEEEKEKEEEEPIIKVGMEEFEAAMASVDPYNEEEDVDFEMDVYDEDSEEESDSESVLTEDMYKEDAAE